MCYPGLAGGTLRGRPTPRFRTIQVCPKDLPARLLQAEDAVVRPLGGGRARAHYLLSSLAWYTGTLYNRLERKGAIVIIGHRTHQDDLQGRLLAQQAAGGDRWTVVELKALSTSGDALWPENAGNSPPTRSMEASQTQPRHGGAFLCRRTVSMTRAPRWRALGWAGPASRSYTTTLRSLSALMILLFGGLSPERTMLIND